MGLIVITISRTSRVLIVKWNLQNSAPMNRNRIRGIFGSDEIASQNNQYYLSTIILMNIRLMHKKVGYGFLIFKFFIAL